MPGFSEASQRSRIAAYAKWAATSDRSAETEPARRAARTKLDERIIERYGLDPDAPDFAKRLEAGRREHFARLALRSAQARRRKARGRG